MKRSPHYGSAIAAQDIKKVMREHDYVEFEAAQVEALEMIGTALAKILCGQGEAEHWKTIEEYAALGREAC